MVKVFNYRLIVTKIVNSDSELKTDYIINVICNVSLAAFDQHCD
jgi:hypothetical protein